IIQELAAHGIPRENCVPGTFSNGIPRLANTGEEGVREAVANFREDIKENTIFQANFVALENDGEPDLLFVCPVTGKVFSLNGLVPPESREYKNIVGTFEEQPHLNLFNYLNEALMEDLLLVYEGRKPVGIFAEIMKKGVADIITETHNLPGEERSRLLGEFSQNIQSRVKALLDEKRQEGRLTVNTRLFEEESADVYRIRRGKEVNTGREILMTQHGEKEAFELFSMSNPVLYKALIASAEEEGRGVVSQFYGPRGELVEFDEVGMVPDIIVPLRDDKARSKNKGSLGGKGANLGEMMSLGFVEENGASVPDGFVLSTNMYRMWREAGRKLTEEMKRDIKKSLEEVFGSSEEGSFSVSVRSGAPVSMPGMMDTEKWVEALQGEKGVFAAVQRVFESWDNPRAREYRRLFGIPDGLGTAVVIQEMKDGTGERFPNSCSGIFFGQDGTTGEDKPALKYIVGDSDLLVRGDDSGWPMSDFERGKGFTDAELARDILARLKAIAAALEEHYGYPQDIEFTVENGELFLLQTRNIKAKGKAGILILRNLVNKGILTPEEAFERAYSEVMNLSSSSFTADERTLARSRIGEGNPVVPGAVSGRIAFSREAVERMRREEDSKPEAERRDIIYVAKFTSPDDIDIFNMADGVITLVGAAESHAAIMARQMNKTCVVGILADEAFRSDIENGMIAYTKDNREHTLREGDVLSMNGETGEIYEGLQETIDGSLSQEQMSELARSRDFARLLRTAEGMENRQLILTMMLRAENRQKATLYFHTDTEDGIVFSADPGAVKGSVPGTIGFARTRDGEVKTAVVAVEEQAEAFRRVMGEDEMLGPLLHGAEVFYHGREGMAEAEPFVFGETGSAGERKLETMLTIGEIPVNFKVWFLGRDEEIRQMTPSMCAEVFEEARSEKTDIKFVMSERGIIMFTDQNILHESVGNMHGDLLRFNANSTDPDAGGIGIAKPVQGFIDPFSPAVRLRRIMTGLKAPEVPESVAKFVQKAVTGIPELAVEMEGAEINDGRKVKKKVFGTVENKANMVTVIPQGGRGPAVLLPRDGKELDAKMGIIMENLRSAKEKGLPVKLIVSNRAGIVFGFGTDTLHEEIKRKTQNGLSAEDRPGHKVLDCIIQFSGGESPGRLIFRAPLEAEKEASFSGGDESFFRIMENFPEVAELLYGMQIVDGRRTQTEYLSYEKKPAYDGETEAPGQETEERSEAELVPGEFADNISSIDSLLEADPFGFMGGYYESGEGEPERIKEAAEILDEVGLRLAKAVRDAGKGKGGGMVKFAFIGRAIGFSFDPNTRHEDIIIPGQEGKAGIHQGFIFIEEGKGPGEVEISINFRWDEWEGRSSRKEVMETIERFFLRKLQGNKAIGPLLDGADVTLGEETRSVATFRYQSPEERPANMETMAIPPDDDAHYGETSEKEGWGRLNIAGREDADEFAEWLRSAKEVSEFEVTVRGRTINIVAEEGIGFRGRKYLRAEDVEGLLEDVLKIEGADGDRIPETLVFTILDRSPSKFEDHKRNGVIGVNRTIMENTSGRVRELILRTGLAHELAHEAAEPEPGKGAGRAEIEAMAARFEKEQKERDVNYAVFLMAEYNVGFLDLYQDISPGLGQDVFIEILRRQIMPEAARFVETVSVSSRQVLSGMRTGEYPSVVLIPVSEDQMLFDGSEYKKIANEEERTIRRKYGINIDVIYYVEKDDASLSEAVEKAIASDNFAEDPRSRLLVYANERDDEKVRSFREKVDKLAGDGYKDRISGVVAGTFVPEDMDDKISVVWLTILGLGLMEMERSPGSAEDMAPRVLRLVRDMISDPFKLDRILAEQGNDPARVMDMLLDGQFLLDVRKIDYEEIRDFMEAEAAVLQSL
ncbi:MAG: hypothetical protein GF408_03630, partial [Candidatus Omnitrophica bacterium]|nr:hypothetical protein [Candidatus Omnitrophota bacterium]